jgi:hypothetical protein
MSEILEASDKNCSFQILLSVMIIELFGLRLDNNNVIIVFHCPVGITTYPVLFS